MAILPWCLVSEAFPMASIIPLENLHPHEYEHPFDAKALDALQNTPGLDVLVRQYNKQAIERLFSIQYTGSSIKVTSKNYPSIYNLLEQSCKTINLPSYPELYIERNYTINGFTIGVENPIIVLASGAIDLLNENELSYLIGHEIGHIKSRHTLYHHIGHILPQLGDIIGQMTLGISKLVSSPLKLALMHWSRMSEFTADRAGLLACQDLTVGIQVMMKLSGLPMKYFSDINHEAFIDQAKQFENLDYDSLNKVVKVFSIAYSTHPWSVLRAAELLKWTESGDYEKILSRNTQDRIYKRYTDAGIFCRSCNSKVEELEKFCESCGSQLFLNKVS